MAAPLRQAGVAFLKRDGLGYDLRGSLTIQPFDRVKTAVVGMDGIHGYKEAPVVPYIEAEITPGTLSLKALQGVTNSTVTAELATGKVYVLRGAWYAGETTLDAEEGKVKLRFEGVECVEI